MARIATTASTAEGNIAPVMKVNGKKEKRAGRKDDRGGQTRRGWRERDG